MATLTIAIPTYNRNESVTRAVSAILPQLGEECHLLILDNCSDYPVAETLAETLAGLNSGYVKVLRNKTNIGSNANILRCMELCDSTWVWIVSDKCIPYSNAVETILANAARNMDATYMWFNSEYDFETQPRTATLRTKGRMEFIKHIDSFGKLIDLNTGVYNAARILPFVRYGYINTYSSVPHLAVLLMAIEKSGVCQLSNEFIVVREFTPLHMRWSRLQLSIACPTLLQLPLSSQERESLWNSMREFLPSVKYCMVVCLRAAANGEQDAAFQLRSFFQARQTCDLTLKTKILRAGAALLMRTPKLSLQFLGFLAQRLWRSSLDDTTDVGRYQSI